MKKAIFKRRNIPPGYVRCGISKAIGIATADGVVRRFHSDSPRSGNSLSIDGLRYLAAIEDLDALGASPVCFVGGEEHSDTDDDLFEALAYLVRLCHLRNDAAGWHKTPREKGTLLMLIVSEVAECMEGERKDLMDDHLPHRKMAEVELADAVIRICDYCGLHGYDLAGAMKEKLEYNLLREDHKEEVRAMEGGKRF